MKSLIALALLTATAQAAPLPPAGYLVFCRDNPVECRQVGAQSIRLDAATQALLSRVNAQVNASIQPVADRGRDTWTLAPRRGDCEDYAVTKRHLLIGAGIPSGAMRFGILRLPDGQYHAVLVVVTDRGRFVLDNLAEGVHPASGRMQLI